MELDFVRLKVLALLKEHGSDLRKASLAMGRNTAYMHQYIYRGSPKVLGEDDRIALAEHLGVDEDDLRHQARPRPQIRPTRRARRVATATDGGPLEGFSKIAEIDVRGGIMGNAPLSLTGRIDPNEMTPTFDIDFSIEGARLVDVNPWLREFLKVDAEMGVFSMYAELAAAEGKFEGYVRPILENPKFVDRDDDEKGPFRKAWEGLVNVAAKILEAENLPDDAVNGDIWSHRYQSINDHEKHLHRNGTRIVKFFLHVSREQQRKRLLSRIDDPEKRWKFQARDVEERKLWDDYMEAYEQTIRHTATKHAPWYVVPADHKWFTRLVVAAALVEQMEKLDLKFPKFDEGNLDELARIRAELAAQLPANKKA